MPWLVFAGVSAGGALVAYLKGQYDAYNVKASGKVMTNEPLAPSPFMLLIYAVLGIVALGFIREMKFAWGK